MVTAQPTSLPRLRQVRVPNLAADGDPAPGEGAVPCPAASKPGSRQWMKNKASMSLSKSLCAQFEHSRARNNAVEKR